MTLPSGEPTIRVGLLERQDRVELSCPTGYVDARGAPIAPGDYVMERHKDAIRCMGPSTIEGESLAFIASANETPLTLASRVGAQFHWSEDEQLQFDGSLTVSPDGPGLRVINDVALETYLASVVASEMSATCPEPLIRAHAVIARSWQIAQRAAVRDTAPWQENAQGLRWYDQSAHADFDVCAEDHCQRYHGVGRIRTDTVRAAVTGTRGEVLVHNGEVCDTRYSKSCGGIVEDARVAWSDDEVPYLTVLFDGVHGDNQFTPGVDVSDERAFRAFLTNPPDAFCQCDDPNVLALILPDRDRRTTPDFFRWRERIDTEELSARVRTALDRDLGRVLALEPLGRGRSGRLWMLRIVGELGEAVVGKELEIRRVLSRSHLKSSAFAVDTEGPAERPDAFVLNGAGWGHGAGLCQIGAAVMAVRGYDYRRILAHYYPHTELRTIY